MTGGHWIVETAFGHDARQIDQTGHARVERLVDVQVEPDSGLGRRIERHRDHSCAVILEMRAATHQIDSHVECSGEHRPVHRTVRARQR